MKVTDFCWVFVLKIKRGKMHARKPKDKARVLFPFFLVLF